MTITLTSFAVGTLCQGCAWTVTDQPELAKRIAFVALGQSRHVAKILSGIKALPANTTTSTRAASIKLLTVPPGTDPWHRDGWLFQTMSWLTALQANPSAIIRAPHMILAHKGFDGLQLELDVLNGAISAAVIFEDKATDNPRRTILREVWPEFQLLEAGDRENVLTADVSSLLGTRPGIDMDKAIENVIWKQVRRYRISVTVGEPSSRSSPTILEPPRAQPAPKMAATTWRDRRMARGQPYRSFIGTRIAIVRIPLTCLPYREGHHEAVGNISRKCRELRAPCGERGRRAGLSSIPAHGGGVARAGRRAGLA